MTRLLRTFSFNLIATLNRNELNICSSLSHSQSVSKERTEFLNLVNKEIEMYNRMVEKEGTDGEEEAKRLFFEAKKEVDRAAHEGEEDGGAGPSQALIKRVGILFFVCYHVVFSKDNFGETSKVLIGKRLRSARGRGGRRRGTLTGAHQTGPYILFVQIFVVFLKIRVLVGAHQTGGILLLF